jgi:protein phosphatase
VNADAVGAYRDPDGRAVFALADGVGDSEEAACAARAAVEAALRTPVAAGALEAVLAAQRALPPGGGDCVLVVAMPFVDRVSAGYRIAWVGDCRAYRWDATSLTQLTVDQTMAEFLRARRRRSTPRMEHVVTNSVRTTTVDEIGWTQVRNVGCGVVLTTDGVHKVLPMSTIHSILASRALPAPDLVEGAAALGGTDNASAIVIDWTPQYQVREIEIPDGRAPSSPASVASNTTTAASKPKAVSATPRHK